MYILIILYNINEGRKIMANIALNLLLSFHMLYAIVKFNSCGISRAVSNDNGTNFVHPITALHHLRLCMLTQVLSLLKLTDDFMHIQVMIHHQYKDIFKNTDYFPNHKSNSMQGHTVIMHDELISFELMQNLSQ